LVRSFKPLFLNNNRGNRSKPERLTNHLEIANTSGVIHNQLFRNSKDTFSTMRTVTLKAIFCDLDGTLVDTKKANYLAYKASMAELNEDFSSKVFLETWGRDSREFLPKLYPHLSKLEINRAREHKAHIYPEFLAHTRLNKSLAELLLLQKQNGSTLGLVTTAKRSNAMQVLEFHNYASIFDLIITGDDVQKTKPDPEAYLLAIEKASVSSIEAITFEAANLKIFNNNVGFLGQLAHQLGVWDLSFLLAASRAHHSLAPAL
jgi:beta-phosphoglucomutase-like phosphatase (HAD superfamily)